MNHLLNANEQILYRKKHLTEKSLHLKTHKKFLKFDKEFVEYYDLNWELLIILG